MSNPRRSLNAYIRVEPLLRLLGCHARLQGLPLKTRCPLCCNGLLTIFHDRVSGGAWHRCRKCQSEGDLIALAARTLKADLPATIAHLAAQGLDVLVDDASIRRYLEDHVEYDERLRKLWQTARQALYGPHPSFNRVAHRLGFFAADWPSKLSDSIGQVFGCLSKEAVEACFAPAVMQAAAERRQKCSPSAHRVFPGAQWEHVLAVPFYDLPGRISSFLFIGRSADPARDFVLKRAHRHLGSNQHVQHDAEAGLAFHPGVMEQADARGAVVAVADPMLMLRLQIRHFSITTVRPLSLIAWIDSDQPSQKSWTQVRTRTAAAWQMFADQEVIFWAPHGLDVWTLRQAIAANGKISLVGPREGGAEALKQYAWRQEPDTLWKHIVAHGRPWHDVLSDELRDQSEAVIHEWLARLEHEQEPIAPILARCSPRIQERVTELIYKSQFPRTIDLDGQTIIEANGSWWEASRRKPGKHLIVDAVLRIDHALFDRERERSYARGRILYRDQVLHFFEPLRPIQDDPAEFMRAKLQQKGLGFLQYNRRYRHLIFRIATTFQQSTMGNAVTRVGWNEDRRRIVLPQFAIHDGGEVSDVHDAALPDDAPAQRLERPSTPSGQELDSATDNDDLARVFWATTCAVIANILAPSCAETTAGICLVGRGAQTVGFTVAEALGCVRVPVRRAGDLQRALDAEQAHGWPVIFDVGPDLQRKHLRRLLSQVDARNCIVAADWLSSRLLALRGGWNIISCDERLGAPLGVLHTASVVLPAYLQHLARRWFNISDWHDEESLTERVIRDVARFVDAGYGDPGAVLSASDVLLPDRESSQAEVIADLLARLIAEGRLKHSSHADGRGKPTLIDNPDHGRLLLPYAALAAAVRDVPVDLADPWHLRGLMNLNRLLPELPRDTFVLQRSELVTRWKMTAVMDGGRLKIRR